jgi:hypothetical protein
MRHGVFSPPPRRKPVIGFAGMGRFFSLGIRCVYMLCYQFQIAYKNQNSSFSVIKNPNFDTELSRNI